MKQKYEVPGSDLLNCFETELLKSRKYMDRRKVFEILVNRCGGSYVIAEKWLFTHYPEYARTSRTLRRMTFPSEKTIKAVMEEMDIKPNDVLSEEELKLLIYLYLRRKLVRCSSEPTGTVS
jgi:hypothetical protein